MKYDAFISYRRKSGTYQATALKEALENRGHKGRIYMDTYNGKGGPFPKELSDALKESCNLIVIISSEECFKAKPNEEDYYLREISDALEQVKNIIPVYYDEIKYEDIGNDLKNSTYNLKNFPKHQAVQYHTDNPDGSIGQIISYIKSEEDILRNQFELVSKKKNEIRQEILYLTEDNNKQCPICHSEYDSTVSYCKRCAYKFFDELEMSVAGRLEQMQEKSRKKKHKEIWENYQQNKNSNKGEIKKKFEESMARINESTQQINTLKGELDKQNSQLEKVQNELRKSNETKKMLEALLKKTTLEFKSVREIYDLIYSCCKAEKVESAFTVEDALLDYVELRFKLMFYNINVNIEEMKNHKSFGGIVYSIRKAEEERKHREEEERTKEKTFTVDGVPFKMIRVEGGSMGTFYIGETQVTQKLWQAVMGNNPSLFKGHDHPVECISWDDICGKDGTGTDPNCFLYKLNKKTGEEFRLPKELEWEYAAKGGNKSRGYQYSGCNEEKDLEEYAWHDKNAYFNGDSNNIGYGTHAVKTRKSNELGLYDMSGNVWEWCQDLYDSKGSDRVLRGGSWFYGTWGCRVTSRSKFSPDDQSDDIGFRLALVHQ